MGGLIKLCKKEGRADSSPVSSAWVLGMAECHRHTSPCMLLTGLSYEQAEAVPRLNVDYAHRRWLYQQLAVRSLASFPLKASPGRLAPSARLVLDVPFHGQCIYLPILSCLTTLDCHTNSLLPLRLLLHVSFASILPVWQTIAKMQEEFLSPVEEHLIGMHCQVSMKTYRILNERHVWRRGNQSCLSTVKWATIDEIFGTRSLNSMNHNWEAVHTGVELYDYSKQPVA